MKKIKKADWVLIILVILLSFFGAIMILSASSASTIYKYHVPSNYFFLRQVIFIIASCLFGFFIILRIPTKKYRLLIDMGMIAIAIALIYVLFKGKVTNHASSWIDLGFFAFQPSEFAKTFSIIFLATFYDRLNITKEGKLSKYLFPVAIVSIFIILIILQPDIGSASILLLILFLVFISLPYVKEHKWTFIKIISICIALVVAGCFIFSDAIFTEERLSRLNYKNPCTRYTEDSGYQTCNGLIAIANGGLFGLGPGNSKQKYMYLPEAHTDFIYPIIIEELGLVTGVVILIVYGIILVRLYKIARRSENLRLSIIAYGTFWYFTSHILINLLGVLALIPLTGVPLPFLSYGGSYTINAICMIFCVGRVSIENKEEKLSRQLQNV